MFQLWKTTTRTTTGAVLMTASLAYCTTQDVIAAPVTSPSVQAAARLANHPPRGWINHYLPADRYKIAGGIWKYVSTETDSHYHLPDSPFMLRQSPDFVIGFASAADAEEGGYKPGPSVIGQDRQRRTNRQSSFSVNSGRTRARQTITSGSTSQTITVPAAAIPKYIADFIRLVDGLAAEIDAASTSSELFRIRRRINVLSRANTAQSGMAHASGDRDGGNTHGSMAGTLEMLDRAIDAKLRPNPAGIAFDKQLLNAARSGARALTPQVQREFRQRVEQNRREMLRRPAAGRPVR